MIGHVLDPGEHPWHSACTVVRRTTLEYPNGLSLFRALNGAQVYLVRLLNRAMRCEVIVLRSSF
jgi:hypothetical protein